MTSRWTTARVQILNDQGTVVADAICPLDGGGCTVSAGDSVNMRFTLSVEAGPDPSSGHNQSGVLTRDEVNDLISVPGSPSQNDIDSENLLKHDLLTTKASLERRKRRT